MMLRLALVVLVTLVSHPIYSQNIYSNNFNHLSPGTYTEDMLDSDWSSPPWSDGVEEGEARTSVSEVSNGNAALAVSFPEGEVGTKDTGAQWRYLFDQSYEAVELSYRFKFGEGFQWSRGGKMPGLAGSRLSNHRTSGSEDAWSGRFMWREDGTAISYALHKESGNNNDGVGEDRDFWEDFTFSDDTWYEFTQRITMNTPGVNDGIIELLIDGQQVYIRNDIRFRDSADLQIDQMFFSTFFGGSNSSWNTLGNETIYFDDFVISEIQPGSEEPEPEPVVVGIDESALPQELSADTMLASGRATVSTNIPADLVIDVLNQSDYSWHGGTRVSVPAGTTTVNFEAPIFNQLTEGRNAIWKLTLVEPGGDWRTTFASGSNTVINVTQGSAGGSQPSLTTLAAPTTLVPGTTYSINVAYETAEAASLDIQLVSSQGAVIANGSRSVSAGEGVAVIPVTIPSNSSGTFTYQGQLVASNGQVLSSAPQINGLVNSSAVIEHNTDLASSSISQGDDLPFFYQVSDTDTFELVYHIFDTNNGNRWVEGSRFTVSGSIQTTSNPIDLRGLGAGDYELDSYLLRPGGTWRDKISLGRRIQFSISN